MRGREWPVQEKPVDHCAEEKDQHDLADQV
jgi:hypothetical protein